MEISELSDPARERDASSSGVSWGAVIGGAFCGGSPFANHAGTGDWFWFDSGKVVFHVGGGVKFRPRDHLLLRAEFLDYLTTFPRTQIVPAPHNTARRIFEQFTPLFSVSYTF